MKKITICAATLSAALLLCGCTTEYPAEAYENHPVSDAFSEALVQSFADNEFDGTIDGLEPLSEADVREEFAVCADDFGREPLCLSVGIATGRRRHLCHPQSLPSARARR